MILKQLGDPEQQGYGAKMAFQPISKNARAGTSWADSTSEDGVTRVTNYSVKRNKGNTAIISISGTENRDTKNGNAGYGNQYKTTGKFSGEESMSKLIRVLFYKIIRQRMLPGTVSVMGQEILLPLKQLL